MSAAAQTKIFGIRLGLDPKVLVFGLVAVAGVLFWYNSRGDNEGSGATASHLQTAQPGTAPALVRPHSSRVRRSKAVNERGTLRVRPIDAANGDVDPTLRLRLLSRLQSVALPAGERNVFEAGQEPAATQQAASAIKAPKIMPGPVTPAYPQFSNSPPPLNIPLKYYGFAKSASGAEPNSGFFLDGDNVLVASEGELLQKRYLVVELTAAAAKLEDTQVKQGQTLQVVPEAVVQ